MEKKSGSTHNSFSGGRQENVFMGRDFYGPVTITTTGRQVPHCLQDPGHWPLCGQWDALTARVHPARPDENGGTVRPRVEDTSHADAGIRVAASDDVPAYVARDIDPEVRARLREAGQSGGAVLMVGDSAAGKTRTLYEALRTQLPRHRFVRPAHPSELPLLVASVVALAEPCVLWLDELHHYLEDERWLTAGMLGELSRSQSVALATLDAASYEHRHNTHAALRRMRPVVLDRRWSVAERRRARASHDPRVVRAAQTTAAFGVAECLAAGPRLWQELRLADRAGGKPRGAALTRAGIDLSRTGLNRPLPSELLLEAHPLYLMDSGGPLLRPEPADDAWAWAGCVRLGVSSMLLPAGEDTWEAHPELVAASQEAAVPVHPLAWSYALGAAEDLHDMFRVATNASVSDPSLGTLLWRAFLDSGIHQAANNLAVALTAHGRLDEAEQVYRTQADMEDATVLYNLGNLLHKSGRDDEAADVYRKSGERGEARAWNNLGLLFKDQGNLVPAEMCLRSAALAGAPDAEYNLAVLLADLGRTDEAEAAYARSYASGDSSGQLNWGILLHEAGRWTEAEPLLRQAVAAGEDEAVFCLANNFKAQRAFSQARDWYQRAIDAGDARAHFNLANMHRDNHQQDLAEVHYRQAIEAGITEAPYNLALLLEEQQRLHEAEPFFRQAVQHGHSESEALLHLGYLLQQTRRPREAAEQWKLAAEAGNTTAAIGLATVLTDSSDQPYLRKVLRRAADAGDHGAALILSVLRSA